MRNVNTIVRALPQWPPPHRRGAAAWLGVAVRVVALAFSAASAAVCALPPPVAAELAAAPSSAAPSRSDRNALIAAPLAQQIERVASDAASLTWDSAAGAVRVEVSVGELDARLRLAPCDRIEPYLPPGQRAFGRTHVGLRCLQGSTHWNVFLPVTVKLFARALVAAAALPVGTLLDSRHLAEAEVDIASRPDPVLRSAAQAQGRTLARPLAAGAALHTGDLRVRQWFNAGDPVRVVAHGAGWSVSAEGQALGAGIEGQQVRVRTEAGRVVSGMPTADRRVEVAL